MSSWSSLRRHGKGQPLNTTGVPLPPPNIRRPSRPAGVNGRSFHFGLRELKHMMSRAFRSAVDQFIGRANSGPGNGRMPTSFGRECCACAVHVEARAVSPSNTDAPAMLPTHLLAPKCHMEVDTYIARWKGPQFSSLAEVEA